MNVVVDTNVLISALIKNSTTRDLIVNFHQNYLLPEFELAELEKHKQEIIEKSRLSENGFETLLTRLLKYVRIIRIDKIMEFKRKAKEIMAHIDEDDVIFITTALACNGVIWSMIKIFKNRIMLRF